MTHDGRLLDRDLLNEISRITNDYGVLQRRTARELAECRAELAKARSVLGAVAHDLRSPLSAVLGFAELLLLDPQLAAEQRDQVERLEHAALAMTHLTEELVDAVTIGAARLRSDAVDVSSVVRHVVTRHQLLQLPRGVQAVVDAPLDADARVQVQGDEAKLERLLDNLVSNAAKFSPDRGRVRISLTRDDLWVEIRVRDDGPGIPADQLDKIFEPFYRTTDAATVPGAGLGLTIVRQIAERHGGRVHAESRPGAGATFVVRLPLNHGVRIDGQP